jgi:ubiquinone/menaquinone biosynthesis C-methylase UbiE
MLRELSYFACHAPSTARLRRRMDRTAFLDLVETRLDQAGKEHWRAALLGDLAGEILEIGAGTGLMFPHYPSGVRLTAIEPDPEFLALAAERARRAAVPIDTRPGVGERLQFPDASFDGVVIGSVLCSVRSVEQTLAEVKRVLRPAGKLRLIEHVRSERPVAGALQKAFNPLWKAINQQGCNMDRDPRQALRDLGFRVLATDTFQLFVPVFPAAFQNVVLWAVRA